MLVSYNGLILPVNGIPSFPYMVFDLFGSFWIDLLVMTS